MIESGVPAEMCWPMITALLSISAQRKLKINQVACRCKTACWVFQGLEPWKQGFSKHWKMTMIGQHPEQGALMKQPIFLSLCGLLLVSFVTARAAESTAGTSTVLLDEKFDAPLGKDWFWGLGTWATTNGVLRGFESGARRHGPVKMRKLMLHDAALECEFRLEGKATFAGIIFNGSQERGHLFHLVMGKDQLRILAHPKKGETRELLKQAFVLQTGTWHRVQMVFKGPALSATVNGKGFKAESPAIAEEKISFGLGGDSGGPAGEKAGALEFRALKICGKP